MEMLTEEKKTYYVDKLSGLIKENNKLKATRIHRLNLERYLYGSDFDVEAAFNKLKSYYELVLEYPDWFPKEGPLDKKSVLEKNSRMMLPQHDKEGRVIYLMKLGNLDLDTMKINDIIAIDDIWFEAITSDPRSTQKGVCYVIDVANYSWKMLKWVTPENIKLTIRKLLAIPFKDFRLHVINSSMVIHVAIKISWPFVPASVKEKIKFHFDDWESFYTHVEKSALPLEYGGEYNVNYNELYEQLYKRNEEILTLLELRRDILFT